MEADLQGGFGNNLSHNTHIKPPYYSMGAARLSALHSAYIKGSEEQTMEQHECPKEYTNCNGQSKLRHFHTTTALYSTTEQQFELYSAVRAAVSLKQQFELLQLFKTESREDDVLVRHGTDEWLCHAHIM